MVQKQWWVKLLVLLPVSGQWHQLVLVVVIFVTATRLQLRIASFIEECLDCIVQVTNFMKCWPLSTGFSLLWKREMEMGSPPLSTWLESREQWWGTKRSTGAVVSIAGRTSHICTWNTIFTWKNYSETKLIKSWVFGNHFLKNEQSVPITSEKAADTVFVASDKIQTCKQKSEFQKFLSTIQYSIREILRSVVIMNVIFWYCIKKCVNIWKIS